MFAAMAAMAFYIDDPIRLVRMFLHYLPVGTTIDKLSRLALRCHDEGFTLAEARERIMLAGGNSEACDSRTNVPFTLLGLLYGNGDLEETMLAALKCGYDTDCTLATSAALLGQIMGAKAIPAHLVKAVGDELVMGIEYVRPEMTVSALARDTVRIGVLFNEHYKLHALGDGPAVAPFPKSVKPPEVDIEVEYLELPSAGPGDTRRVRINARGKVPAKGNFAVKAPFEGWTVTPADLASRKGPAHFGIFARRALARRRKGQSLAAQAAL